MAGYLGEEMIRRLQQTPTPETPHSHLIERLRAERRVAEAMVHFGLGGSVEQNAADITLRRENREIDEAPYLKPTPERKLETVGGVRI